MAKLTHPIAWFLLRRLAYLKRSAARLFTNLWIQLILGIFGMVSQLMPWLVIRIVTLWIIVPGDFSPALNRLLWGLPVYGFWCGFSAYWVREYCMIWVTVGWLLLLLLGGFVALDNTQLRRKLRLRYPFPAAVSTSIGAASLLMVACSAAALIYVSPIEFLRGNAPDFSHLTPAELNEQLTADEQTLSVIRDGLKVLNPPTVAASPSFSSSIGATEQQQAVVLRYHTALQRLAWRYQNYGRLGDNAARKRAQSLHLNASTAAHDLTQRWNPCFDDVAKAELLAPLSAREPRHGEGLLDSKWVEKLRPFLQPGDIVLTQANGYLATGLLPGVWSQMALYVGTSGQLQAAGLDQDLRIQMQLDTFSVPKASGCRPALIRAVGPGVEFSTLEQMLSEADSVAVLRPKLPLTQRLEMLARAFAQTGKPYDYAFDFAQADKLMCSELVARALNGFVDFPLEMIHGQPLLTGDGLVRFWSSSEGGPQLDFVAFVKGNKATGDCNWASPGDLALIH